MNEHYQDDSKDYTETLTGHTSAESGFVVADYPYGFRLRTQIRYWIETKKNQGQRFVSQTLNPKNGKWNKPKAGTYSEIKCLTRNPKNGYISTDSLRFNDTDEEIESYIERHKESIEEYERVTIEAMKLWNQKMSKVYFKIG